VNLTLTLPIPMSVFVQHSKVLPSSCKYLSGISCNLAVETLGTLQDSN
jgi:hypothetical protein